MKSRVSLIILRGPGAEPDDAYGAHLAAALVTAGHEVQTIHVGEPEGPGGDVEQDGRLLGHRRGRTPAAFAGLNECQHPLAVIVDAASRYTAEDVLRVVEALEAGRAEVVVGCRPRGPSPVRRLIRSAVGTSDPASGLVGIDRRVLEPAEGSFHAVGSRFALELVTKLPGRVLDLPVPQAARPMAPRRGELIDEIRHLKHLADHRFGNYSRLLQFCAVGASGMVVDLTTYAGFQWIFAHTDLAHRSWPVLGSLDLAASGFLSVGLALCWNFSLNRRLTFNDARHGATVVRQFVAYALSNALAITVNLGLRLNLPRAFEFFDRHRLMAAVVGIVLATAISFSMSRWLVFRRGSPSGPGPASPPADGESAGPAAAPPPRSSKKIIGAGRV